jgi:hypothetical protein
VTGKVAELNDILDPDQKAIKVTELYMSWDSMRQLKKQEWEEIRRYVYATNTRQTSNSSLPWKNSTTIPKLCQIRDNLLSNYTATEFPKRKWVKFEAGTQESDEVMKRNAIEDYMSWVIMQPSFKPEMEKCILDYIDFGNCFATVEWVDQRVQQPSKTQAGYVGPAIRRISPLDIVFNPTADNFQVSPKIIRSIISIGELREILQRMSSDENREEYEELYKYLKDLRLKARSFQGDWAQQDALYSIDGFTSFREYLQSDYVEILTFYGDYYDRDNDDFQKNRVVTVVDRHKLLGDKPNPSFFGYPPIFHVPWRKKQDNLWGMGPLDNLIGMQYRLDHIENMRADVVDLTTFPVQMVTGFVEPFTWQPGEKIYAGEEGKVELITPEVNVLQANFELAQLEQKMEEMAGAPKEAMGFRSPGEKTKYEVQRLENAASRVFQNKIRQFEEQFVEPLLNAMLELSQRNMTSAMTIKTFDNELDVSGFRTLTVEDVTGVGRIKPVAARHFAEQAELIQNLTSLTGSNLWPTVQPHFSGVKLAKVLEDAFDIADLGVVIPYIALAEQADAQKQAQALQEQVHMAAMTATGRGEDFDMEALNQAMSQQPQAQGTIPPNVQ